MRGKPHRALLVSLVLLQAPLWLGPPADAQPSRATLEVRALSTTEVALYWGESNDPDVTSYVVLHRREGQLWQRTEVGRAPSHELRGLAPGGTYAFQVLARTKTGAEVPLAAPRSLRLPARPGPEAAPRARTPGALDVVIRSINVDDFPAIQLTVAVSDGAGPVEGLDLTHFALTESYSYTNSTGTVVGSTPIGSFSVLDGSDSSRPADIVFVIDDTGSMSNEIATVRTNVQQFADDLAASGIDYRLGLVRFKDENDTSWLNSGNLTGDKETFKAWVDALTASGGGDTPENSFGALVLATQMTFRPSSQRIFVLVTDAASHERAGFSLTDTVQAILDVDGVCYVAGPNNSQYNGSGSLTDETGGTWYPVTSDLSGIIADIGETIGSAYSVLFQTPRARPDHDSEEREVTVDVTAPSGDSGTDTAPYTPKLPPAITLDAETEALLGAAQPEGDTLTIGVDVADRVEPFTLEVSLNYRPQDETLSASGEPLLPAAGPGARTAEFAQVPMSRDGGSTQNGHYTAQIPAAAVRDPGVAFYLTATDGQASSSLPVEDPAETAFNIAVLPNQAPVIQHEAPSLLDVTELIDVPLEAVVTDTTNSLASVKVTYRVLNPLFGLIPITLPMSPTAGDLYRVSLPGVDFNRVFGGFRYFILAEDDLGTRSRLPASGEFIIGVPAGDPDDDELTNLEEHLGADGIAPGEPGDTGDETDPRNPDTDGDALLDGWEVNGITGGGETLDLASLGANPLHKDLFVEIDYFERTGTDAHSHLPSTEALARAEEAFAAAPAVNPDGVPGITLHCLLDESITETDTNEEIDVGTAELDAIRDAHFPDGVRRSVFRWALFAHGLPGGSWSGKASGIPGGYFLVTLGKWSVVTDQIVAGTFLHELGHTLDLQHGGADGTHRKPNYLSLMNYSFQNVGLTRDGVTGVLDFSRRELPDLAEDSLSEPVGIGDPRHRTKRSCATCPGDDEWLDGEPPAVDWNDDGDEDDTGVNLDLNEDGDLGDTLAGFDDWTHLISRKFAGGSVGDPFGIGLPPLEGDPSVEDLTFETVQESGPASVPAVAASPFFDVIAVGWPGSEDADVSFRILRGTSPTSLSEIATLQAALGFYLDGAVVPGVTYWYALAAVNAFGVQGPVSAPVSAVAGTAMIDTDRDGLSDAWERAYGLDPNSPDSDGDGILDGAEDQDDDGASNFAQHMAACVLTGDVQLSGLTIDTGAIAAACGRLTLGPALRIDDPGSLRAIAGEEVVIRDGFAAGAGATVEIAVIPSIALRDLFDQTGLPAAEGWTSQEFEPESSAFDSQAADDFTVPPSDVQWNLTRIEIQGRYSEEGLPTTPFVNASIWLDAAGQPGEPWCTYTGLQAGVDFSDDSGDLRIDLPLPCIVPTGTYWLGVQADLDFAVSRQWFWRESSGDTGGPFVWQNPGDGFSTGCTSWTPAAACGASNPGLVFSLSGNLTGRGRHPEPLGRTRGSATRPRPVRFERATPQSSAVVDPPWRGEVPSVEAIDPGIR